MDLIQRSLDLDTGWAHLIRTRLIRNSTLFVVSVKSLPDFYQFKMYS